MQILINHSILYNKMLYGNLEQGRRQMKQTRGPFLESPKTFRARKAIRKITTCIFCKADLFTCCKGNKNKNNDKVSYLETPSFWRYKENYVTRKTPEKFRDFRETGPRFHGKIVLSRQLVQLIETFLCNHGHFFCTLGSLRNCCHDNAKHFKLILPTRKNGNAQSCATFFRLPAVLLRKVSISSVTYSFVSVAFCRTRSIKRR